ncbi:DUF2993 domain-containing protein [Natroniella acetigena]|uniref:LmeA family phospholipid-binding protein n=1 Tax=Natroniella acetigena TaxID=52004 RepID=UPI00200A3EF7|nr:DUF2993 domain-containing protein [Natroniella acetigena]
MLKKLIKPAVILLLLLLVGSQLILPRIFSTRLESSLSQELDDYEQLDVTISSFPAIKLLAGRVDQLEIKANGLVSEQLTLERLEGSYSDLKLVKGQDEQWQVSQGENTELEIELTDQDLNHYLATRPELDILDAFRIDLTSDQMVMVGKLSFFNTELSLQLTGKFSVYDHQTLIFNSDKLAVDRVVISTDVIEQLKDKLGFKISLANFPLPLELTEVKVEEGSLQLLGGTRE